MSHYPPPGQYPPSGQYPPPPGQPGQPGYWQESPKGKGLAITALVLGIIALLSCWTLVGGILFGVFAIIFGLIAGIKARNGTAGGGGMAVAGALLGLAGIVISVVIGLFFWNIFEDAGFTDFVDCVSSAGNDQAKVQQCEDEFNQNVQDRFSITVTPGPTN
ncbi:DUF4190 domain-containing protein [Nocardia sp. NPDC050697]|uniref:DUF4190 domain-containing protein n=1 Tax=Nocardia sp. NPDC050697 TaxID=3155158 RepID=UPI0033F9A66E